MHRTKVCRLCCKIRSNRSITTATGGSSGAVRRSHNRSLKAAQLPAPTPENPSLPLNSMSSPSSRSPRSGARTRTTRNPSPASPSRVFSRSSLSRRYGSAVNHGRFASRSIHTAGSLGVSAPTLRPLVPHYDPHGLQVRSTAARIHPGVSPAPATRRVEREAEILLVYMLMGINHRHSFVLKPLQILVESRKPTPPGSEFHCGTVREITFIHADGDDRHKKFGCWQGTGGAERGTHERARPRDGTTKKQVAFLREVIAWDGNIVDFKLMLGNRLRLPVITPSSSFAVAAGEHESASRSGSPTRFDQVLQIIRQVFRTSHFSVRPPQRQHQFVHPHSASTQHQKCLGACIDRATVALRCCTRGSAGCG